MPNDSRKLIVPNLRRRNGLLRLVCLLLIFAATGAAAFGQAEERREQVKELANDEIRAQVLDKFVTVKLSPQCWDRMLKVGGKDTLNRIGISVVQHAVMMGYGDLDQVGGGSDINWEKANRIFAHMNGKISFAIEAGQTACSAEQWDVMSRFSLFVAEFFAHSYNTYGMAYNWRPRAGKALVKTVFSSSAKDVSVAISADGANFTVTVPSGAVDQFKWNGWEEKISQGLAKGGAKKSEK